MQRKFNYIGIAIIIIVIVAFAYQFYIRPVIQKAPLQEEELGKLSPEHPGQVITFAATGTLPAGFSLPSDFPEKNPAIVQSYLGSYTTTTAQQVSVTYFSKSSAEQNFSEFKKFFERHHWTITASVNKPDVKFFNLSKPDKQGQLVIVRTSAGSRVTLSEFYENGIPGL